MKIILHKFFQKYRFLLKSDKQDETTKKSLKRKIEICSDDDLNLSNAEEMSKLKGRKFQHLRHAASAYGIFYLCRRRGLDKNTQDNYKNP